MGITINGTNAAGNIDLGTNGTITDLAVGGLPDGTVDADTLAAGTVGGATGTDYNDSVKVRFGTGNDMEIYHNGTDAIIDAEGSGATRSLILKGGTTTDRLIELQSSDGEPHVRCAANSYVKLYHDNSLKLETTTTGIKVQGGILFGSDTAAENTLSDYEEGTFTPTFTTWNGSSTIPTINSSYGWYVKTGKFVKVWWFIVFASAQQGNTQWGTLAKPISAHTGSSFIDGLFAGGTTENGGFHYIESGAGVNYLSGTVDSGSTTSWAGGFSYKTG